MDISKVKLKDNPNRRDVLDVCVGLVTDKYGPVRTYDELVAVLQREFPELNFTFDEVIEFSSLQFEREELQIYLEHINYGDRSLYQYREAH